MAEVVGPDSKPCLAEKHLWMVLPTSEEQQRVTGKTEYEICGKCNAIKEPA